MSIIAVLVFLSACNKASYETNIDIENNLDTNEIETSEQENSSEADDIDDSLIYQYSKTVEKEKPELDEITKELVSAYHKNPTQENYDALRTQAEIDYDKVLDKKKAKLEELIETAKEESKIQEMQVIVDEMILDRENRIDQTMSRLTDVRLRPGSNQSDDGYYPVMGAGENIYISYTEVSNAQYEVFVEETDYVKPKQWINGQIPEGKENHPVTGITYYDALKYCEWLSEKDGNYIFRLPSEEEWELAAGHMPKDADMNTGKNDGTSEVDTFEEIISACGAIDMWGNVWEWTSIERSNNSMAVKGGSFSTAKTECRTENCDEERQSTRSYSDVGFRVVREG